MMDTRLYGDVLYTVKSTTTMAMNATNIQDKINLKYILRVLNQIKITFDKAQYAGKYIAIEVQF